MFRVVFRYRVEGLEKVPKSGGVLLVANHAHLLDPPLVGSANRRQVHFMAKDELFHMPFLRWALPKIGTFPVRRGAADRKAIRTAIELLSQGKVVAIFPEGTRTQTGELLEPQRGAGLIALRAGVPVIPVGITGTFEPVRKGRFFPRFNQFIVRFGDPVHFEPSSEEGRKDAVDEANRRMMEGIKAQIGKGLKD